MSVEMAQTKTTQTNKQKRGSCHIGPCAAKKGSDRGDVKIQKQWVGSGRKGPASGFYEHMCQVTSKRWMTKPVLGHSKKSSQFNIESGIVFPPWVAGIDLTQSRCRRSFVSFTNKHIFPCLLGWCCRFHLPAMLSRRSHLNKEMPRDFNIAVKSVRKTICSEQQP